MREYVVYRHGWNDVNQDPKHGLPEKMAVGRIEAESPEEACQRVQPDVLVLTNQYLSAEPATEVDAKEELLNKKP
jgi:hypothetical protein